MNQDYIDGVLTLMMSYRWMFTIGIAGFLVLFAVAATAICQHLERIKEEVRKWRVTSSKILGAMSLKDIPSERALLHLLRDLLLDAAVRSSPGDSIDSLPGGSHTEESLKRVLSETIVENTKLKFRISKLEKELAVWEATH